jgi:hypothetical protein
MHLSPSNKGSEYIDALDAYRDALLGVALANTGREAPMRAADEACFARGTGSKLPLSAGVSLPERTGNAGPVRDLIHDEAAHAIFHTSGQEG